VIVKPTPPESRTGFFMRGGSVARRRSGQPKSGR
jgi:hypothetical protein